MNLESFITAYGYPALGIGTLLEGGMVGMVAGEIAGSGGTRNVRADQVDASGDGLREQAEETRLGLLWQQSDFAKAWRWASDLGAVSIHPHWMLVSPDVVREAHARGLQVITWTVNDVGTMRDLVRQEVDGIISDFPERFQNATA